MYNQSEGLPQDLSLQRPHVPSASHEDLPVGLHLKSTELLSGQHNVPVSMLDSSLHFKQDGHVPQGFNTSHVSPTRNLMPSLLNTSNIVETADSLLSKQEEHSGNGFSTIYETSVLDRNCGSFPAEDSLAQQQYAAFGTLLTDLTARPHQTEDRHSHNQSGDPTSSLQDDMETCNDSSSNDLNESEENGKESASKSGSNFQPPPCTSNAFSLMMADSERNPSTSGYSSEQPAKAKTQNELMKILKELRSYLPPEKRSRSKSCTAASLHYALHCIQQVKANEEYYQFLMTDDQQCSKDLSCYTVEEIASITSEYTKNNIDVFAVAVSLITGQILYISEQASTLLRCSMDLFSRVRFVELLAPQDVGVFYSSTNPFRLPSWSICNGVDSGSVDGLEEKSFYCRLSCGRESRREVSYHPFRMTPYLIRVQVGTDGGVAEQQCCVLFAERVHSGYEAPRIPADKRIFTTTHTPSCLFQDVDERAVPLLGYLPQDLVDTPILLHLHPSDRPLMLAVHKKILQNGGQPFEFSPIRFCARNGEYITLDTSWSSFINPWSRKVSFIIGRHKVRMGPVNEDVFTAPPCSEDRSLPPDVQELTEQIHQLLMQPVQNSGSSGYGSLGSNGSHENPMSGASSSDSNGNLIEDMKEKQVSRGTNVRELKGSTSLEAKVHQNLETTPDTGTDGNVKGCNKGVNGEGSGTATCPVQSEQLPPKQPSYSYQQINCLDSVIRYLESCTASSSDKQMFVSPGSMPSFPIDGDHTQTQDQGDSVAIPVAKPTSRVTGSARCPQSSLLSGPATTSNCQSVPVPLPQPSLTSLPVSGATITQLSLAAKAASVLSLTSHCSYSSTIVHVGDKKLQPETELEDSHCEVLRTTPDNTEREPYKQLGLTKEVLVAHTQKEESAFLNGFMDIKKLSAFQTRCNSYMHERAGALQSHGSPGADPAVRRSGKARRSKVKRVRPESWDSSSSGVPRAHRATLPGPIATAWSHSGTSHASYPALPYPVLSAYPLPVFPPTQIPVPSEMPNGAPSTTLPIQPFPTPLLPPMVALVLPNYAYPPGMAPAVYPAAAPPHPFPVQSSLYTPQPTMAASNPPFPVSQPTFPVPQSTFPVPQAAFPVAPSVYPPHQHAFPGPQPPCAPQNPCPVQQFSYPIPPSEAKMKESLSRSSTPRDPPSPLFQSRCSSPLQLNLLQLEESQKTDRSEGGTGGPLHGTFKTQRCEDLELHLQRAGSPAYANNSDAMSTGSDLMDIMLQEDASSVVSESLTSGSHGIDTSGSQTGSSHTSHSSKYFGSVDSSENTQKAKASTPSTRESIMKYVLQDPMWLLMANADEKVMMTYQIPLRDMDVVLREDRDRLKRMQKRQPRFTDDQRKELGEIHAWLQGGGLPWTVEMAGCFLCQEKGTDCAEYSDTIQDLELMESCD